MTEFPSFDDLRIDIATDFAQTMIVVDDQASQADRSKNDKPVQRLQSPNRITRSKGGEVAPANGELKVGSVEAHSLDAKALIDRAMDLGLICSVLSPEKEENFTRRVVNAARHTDIVCLDWEIYNDGGDAASSIVSEIIKGDARSNGRLRLIAIYTGDTTNNKILEKIWNMISKSTRTVNGFRKTSLTIENDVGTKIVCLFKAHGVKLRAPRNVNQIEESELPDRLLREFSSLSSGLLSTVALGIIASIRDATHHVLAKFTAEMDGPYFHHRASISTPEDAEEYAIEVVLSELKSAIDKQGVATRTAGSKAIKTRLDAIANGRDTLTFCYMNNNNNKEEKFDVPLDCVKSMIIDGVNHAYKSGNGPLGIKPKKFEQNFTNLFAPNLGSAEERMMQFAALTEIRASPLSGLYKTGDWNPDLGLGTIVERQSGQQKVYLLCLQAACDSVRLVQATDFVFIPLDVRDKNPEHVVPITSGEQKDGLLGLGVDRKAYTRAESFKFVPNESSKKVVARRNEHRSGWFYEDSAGEVFRWIADLKRRRALRIAQLQGQNMGRLGFDEFEPFRKNGE